MHKLFLQTGCVFGALSVILGAFGAHSLKKMVSAETLAAFETGARYQFYHTLALMLVAILYEKFHNRWMVRAGYSYIIGTILFSGSLYALTAINATNTVGLAGLGILTPIGGLFFIAGWIFLIIATTGRGTSGSI
ncbi:MAG: DUF423 domain-containing protein [Chitinophagaceae bacterium]